MTGRTRRGDLAARAAAIAGGNPAAADPATEHEPAAAAGEGSSDEGSASASVPPPGRPRPAPRTKPVRVTVELQPVEHRGLRRLCSRYAEELEIPTVAGAEVLRVLLELAQADDEIVSRVGARLGQTGGSRRRWS